LDDITEIFLTSIFLHDLEKSIDLDDFIYYHSSISAELSDDSVFESFMRSVWVI